MIFSSLNGKQGCDVNACVGETFASEAKDTASVFEFIDSTGGCPRVKGEAKGASLPLVKTSFGLCVFLYCSVIETLVPSLALTDACAGNAQPVKK